MFDWKDPLISSRLERSYRDILIDVPGCMDFKRASARFSTSGGVTRDICIDWGTEGWSTALQKRIWGFGLMANSICAKTRPWQSKVPTTS